MASQQWSRIKELLDALLDAEPENPDAWLKERCEDSKLRAEVKSLHSAYKKGILKDVSPHEWLGGLFRERDQPRSSGEESRPKAGNQIGKYNLREEIGIGGMSVVYRAERTGDDFNQTVAVKLLQRRLHAVDAEKRFRAERQILARLEHPNIARLIDGGITEGGRPYLVMELVDGVPIIDYADRNELGLEERLDLLEQIFEAVQEAHRQLVVHRDLKPSNVLVSKTEKGPQVKLLDFGIAKLLDDSLPVTRPMTQTGRHLLTPSYAAPEQVTDADVSTATDIYQLGILAYELLAGTRPFDLSGKSPTEIERVVTGKEPAPPSDRARGGFVSSAELRGDLDRILQKALRKEPARRYPSVDALAADLHRHRANEPVEARPATLGYRTRKFVQRHRWGVGVAAAFLLMTSISGALLLRQRANAEEQRNLAQAEAEAATQVSDFLVELFEANNPSENPDSLAARDLLRRGQNRLETLEGQPAVQGRMLDAMARAHYGLGNYEMADSLLQHALALRRESHGDDHPNVARTLYHLGLLKDSEYAWEEALAYHREARSTLRAQKHPLSRSDSLLTADILSSLGRALRNTGHPDSAETTIRQGLSIREAVQGSDHPEVWSDKSTLAYVLRESGSAEEAKRIYREVLQWQRENADSLAVANTLNNLGYLLRSEGKLEQATRRYQASLRINEREFGPAHPRTLMIRGNNLGTLFQAQGDFDAAETLYRKQLRNVREHYRSDHWRVGKWAQSLGEILLFQDQQFREAENLLREATRIYEASDIASRTSTLKHQALLGRCLVMRNKDKEARPLLEESYAVLSSDSVDARIPLAHAQAGLGLYHTRHGSYAKAESLLAKAHSTFDWAFNDFPGVNANQKPVRQVQNSLAHLYESWGQPEKADRFRRMATSSKAPVAER